MKIFIFISSIFISLQGYNQTIATDRPDQTESSSTVPKNGFQIESGTYFEVTPLDKTILIPTSLFRIGVTKKVELRVFSQIEKVSNDSSENIGVSDLELGTKIQLYKKESSSTEMALMSHFALPVGSEQLTTNSYGFINKILMSHQITPNFSLGYNLGYSYFTSNQNSGIFTLSFAFKLSDKMGVYFEPYGTYENKDSYFINADGGFAYLIQDNLQFDYSFGLGLNNRMNYHSIGISWLIL